MSGCSFDPDKPKHFIMTTNPANTKVPTCNLHQDLVDDCKNGDQKAQFQIYKLYYKAMYNISLRIVKDPMEAEDIMQESFLSAFEEIRKYSGKVSFGAWLKKIVQNRSIDLIRKKSRMVFEEIESFQGTEENLFENIYQNEESDLRMNRVMEIIKRLPRKCRDIFSLYFLEGYDHEEISEIMSISGSTSRSQLSRARLRFISEYKNKY